MVSIERFSSERRLRRRAYRCVLFIVTVCLALRTWTGCATPPPRMTWTLRPWSHEDRAGVWIETPHFDIYTTVQDERLREGLATALESVYRQLAMKFPPNPGSSPRATTYVFESRAQWERFLQGRFPARSADDPRIRAGVLTQGSVSALYFTTHRETLTTAAHEAWHQYAHQVLSAPLPAWLDEGLACYFESFDFTHDPPRFSPRTNPLRLEHLRNAVLSDRQFPLHDLLTTHADAVLAQDNSIITQTYYAQLWALMLFLQQGPSSEYRAAFDRLLRDVGDGSLPIRVRAATLGQVEASPASFGRTVFALYFSTPGADMEALYRQFLVDLTGMVAVSPSPVSPTTAQPG